MRQSKRRNKLILINRDFQFRYAGAAIVVGLTSTALTAFLILYPLYKFEILRMAQFVPLPILTVMLVAAIANMTMVGVMAIYITHKIAGPMYRIAKSFRMIEEGHWGVELKTRDSDELGYLVRNFNGMVDGLRRVTASDCSKLEQICTEMAQTHENSIDSRIPEALQHLALTMRQRLASYEDHCESPSDSEKAVAS